MAKRPLKNKEDIEAVPIDQDVELELSDDPVVVVTSDDGTKKDKKANGHIEPHSADAEDSAALLKQLEDLKRSEEAARTQSAEWERQAREAAQRAQELEQQNSQQQNQQLETEYDSVLNAINAAESEANAAQIAYEKAAEVGDYKAMGDAQRKISRAEARLEGLEQGKYAIESRREAIKAAPPKKETQIQADPFEQAIGQLPEAAKNWLRGHREYMTDSRKNIKIQAAHFDVLDEGVSAYSPEYFESLETKLGLRQKKLTTDDQDQDDPPSRRTPVSAPVSRDPVSPSTGRSTSTSKITLTAEQRQFAHTALSHLDPAEAEIEYAKQLMKLRQLKAQGHYQEN